MKDFVISLLKDNHPKSYFYHNHEHTLYVLEKAVEIGKYEECTKDELELLGVAALWHDIGYTKTYLNHEEESCKLAWQYLPEYGYPSHDIEKVCGMIMATKIPQMPKNKLEEIIADADLEYLGTASFEIKSISLFHEIESLNPSLTEEKWNQLQISFLQNNHYFTSFCKENREHLKMKYLYQLVHQLR